MNSPLLYVQNENDWKVPRMTIKIFVTQDNLNHELTKRTHSMSKMDIESMNSLYVQN